MTNKHKEKFTPIEVVYLVIAFAVFVGSLCFVLLTKLDKTPDEITVGFSNFDGGYDASVINSATVEDFMRVNGIGEVKANSIISYRESLGGFESIYQLLDLNNLTSQNFEDIIVYFYFMGQTSDEHDSEKTDSVITENIDNVIDSPEEGEDYLSLNDTDIITTLRKVNINTASAIDISSCLLLDIEQAEQIVSMRERLGVYNNIQEVLLCDLITEDIYSKIKEYLLL
ncbi:MAG: helix-hairpin-helix domain-containing protein [Oscillospiraceae bacterium]|nr:helix-hairpin-helix domain-containing protein [Oscillospiraceae bacterium]